MKLGCVITMYDEYDTVASSIGDIRYVFPDSFICVSHSDDKSKDGSDRISQLCDSYKIFPDLSKEYPRYEYASYSICRNLEHGFSEIYKSLIEFDLIVAFTGDTLITDATNFTRRMKDIQNHNLCAMVSQAIGQRFHSPSDDPENGVVGHRFQGEDTTDFACCLFMVEGEFARNTKVFSSIEVCNRFTSEQCLGDELVDKANKQFHSCVGRLNKNNKTNSYAYNDGIVYHSTTGGAPGR